MFFIPVVYVFMNNFGSSGNKYLLKQQSAVPIFVFVAFLAFFIGFRPQMRGLFGDSGGYRMVYLATDAGSSIPSINLQAEWLWQLIIVLCRKLGLSVQGYFMLISAGYFGFMFWTCKKMIYENATVPVLFFLSSFSFFSYSVNTIRNGLACSIVLLALSYWTPRNRKVLLSFVLFFLALGIHRSTMIPITAILLSTYVIKTFRKAVLIWFVSIILSLLFGSAVSSIFSIFNTDTRFQDYMAATNLGLFSHTGFRWDFLLYSSVPVALTWYITEFRGVQDRVFSLISNTYLLANSVWILCINASFSDRFAYLSWFMYPLVLSYAFVRLPLFINQDKVMAWALFFNASFTFFMFVVIG